MPMSSRARMRTPRPGRRDGAVGCRSASSRWSYCCRSAGCCGRPDRPWKRASCSSSPSEVLAARSRTATSCTSTAREACGCSPPSSRSSSTTLWTERVVGYLQQLALVAAVYAMVRPWGRRLAVGGAVIAGDHHHPADRADRARLGRRRRARACGRWSAAAARGAIAARPASSAGLALLLPARPRRRGRRSGFARAVARARARRAQAAARRRSASASVRTSCTS